MITQNELEELKRGKEKLLKEYIEKLNDPNTQLSVLDMYAHCLKNTCKNIEECEKDLMQSEFSNGYSYMMPQYNDGGYSGAMGQGRGSQANRSANGQYASHGDWKPYLYQALEHAPSENERQLIQSLINGSIPR